MFKQSVAKLLFAGLVMSLVPHAVQATWQDDAKYVGGQALYYTVKGARLWFKTVRVVGGLAGIAAGTYMVMLSSSELAAMYYMRPYNLDLMQNIGLTPQEMFKVKKELIDTHLYAKMFMLAGCGVAYGSYKYILPSSEVEVENKPQPEQQLPAL